MLAAFFALAVLAAQNVHPNTAPSYSTASVLNAATNLPGFAPNTIVSIYGSDLSYNTAAMPANANALPTTLGGVTVYFGGAIANLFFVSPHQINVLIPYDIYPGPVTVRVVREGTAGPQAAITIAETSPGMFQQSPDTIVATRPDGSLITSDLPSAAGDVIVLYAVGLGRTVPDVTNGAVSNTARPILRLSDFKVLLNSVVVDPSLIFYAGITPGCAGLYQINLILPANLPTNPEIRIAIGDQISPSFLKLPTQ